jgi:hypothetical protein
VKLAEQADIASEASSRAEQLEEDLAGLRAQVAQVCVTSTSNHLHTPGYWQPFTWSHGPGTARGVRVQGFGHRWRRRVCTDSMGGRCVQPAQSVHTCMHDSSRGGLAGLAAQVGRIVEQYAHYASAHLVAAAGACLVAPECVRVQGMHAQLVQFDAVACGRGRGGDVECPCYACGRYQRPGAASQHTSTATYGRKVQKLCTCQRPVPWCSKLACVCVLLSLQMRRSATLTGSLDSPLAALSSEVAEREAALTKQLAAAEARASSAAAQRDAIQVRSLELLFVTIYRPRSMSVVHTLSQLRQMAAAEARASSAAARRHPGAIS